MQYDKTDERMLATLDVVAKYDAALYRRMMADDWTATFRFEDLPADIVADMRDNERGEVYGVTAPKLCAGSQFAEEAFGPASRVTLNWSAIKKRAFILRVPPAMFAAVTLAHEYRHLNQPQCNGDPFTMEPPAYDAGTEFAQRLPTPLGARIASFNEMAKENNGMAAFLGYI